MNDVTIVTASIPERTAMLGELLESVRSQTRQPAQHLIAVDWSTEGFVATINRLARMVNTTWLMIQPDDDLLDPHHLETLSGYDTDIVYSWCRTEGRDWTPNAHFDPVALREQNYIPGGSCLIRTGLWNFLGGYRKTTDWDCAEDWEFWIRALEHGATFTCVPEVTWTYRFHGRNLSLGELPYNCK